ncbi:hypothetical protein FHW88_001497 [Mucilaginibacter sp. SG538B]|uniref:hypothetical protein n=1 Tax=Mucilaginibacter sp. SG538B TaxID=2587021 RepID=UPI00159D4DA6|nr:hypothetical protein [Mucilaginibacter sp. SG538B]NVM63221.1 hypothetical protein [Mucilaginibacter sp. SG538B]
MKANLFLLLLSQCLFAFLSLQLLSSCNSKSNSSSFAKMDSTLIVQNQFEADLEDFGDQVNYNKHYNQGVSATVFALMQKVYPMDSFAGIEAKIKLLSSDKTIQDGFLNIVCNSNKGGKNLLQFTLYSLCHNAQTALRVTDYCYQRFRLTELYNSRNVIDQQTSSVETNVIDPAVIDTSVIDTASSNENSFANSADSIRKNSYVVIVAKSYFHSSAERGSVKRSYLIKGNIVSLRSSQGNFCYVEFIGANHKITRGWILISDLKREIYQ